MIFFMQASHWMRHFACSIPIENVRIFWQSNWASNQLLRPIVDNDIMTFFNVHRERRSEFTENQLQQALTLAVVQARLPMIILLMQLGVEPNDVSTLNHLACVRAYPLGTPPSEENKVMYQIVRALICDLQLKPTKNPKNRAEIAMMIQNYFPDSALS